MMMLRSEEKKRRKEKVLTTVVKTFVDTCFPVSSEYICENCGLDCSSATIRNDMMELEKEGFLKHLHTSSGRVPTEKAYRYFVDFYLERKALEEDEKQKIISLLSSSRDDLDHILDKASQVLADITKEVGMVSFIEKEGRIYKHGLKYATQVPEFHDAEILSNVFEFLEDDESLWTIMERFWEDEARSIMGSEFDDERFVDLSLVIHSYDTRNAVKGKMAVFGPMRMDYERIYGSLEFISQQLREILWRMV